MTDEKLRAEVMRAFGTARELYGELIAATSDRPITLASRVATDDDDPRQAPRGDRRPAPARASGSRARRAGALVGRGPRRSSIAGIALGILFNPVTGAETRRFIKDLISSGGEERRASRGLERPLLTRLAIRRRAEGAPQRGRVEPVRGGDVGAPDQDGAWPRAPRSFRAPWAPAGRGAQGAPERSQRPSPGAVLIGSTETLLSRRARPRLRRILRPVANG